MLEIEDFLNRKSCIEIKIETKDPALEFNQEKINSQVDNLVKCLCDNCSSGFLDRLTDELMRQVTYELAE